MLFSDKIVQLDSEVHNHELGDKTVEQIGTNCRETYFKFVGHVLDDKLTWQGHIEHICKKLASANFAINSTKNFRSNHAVAVR